MKWVIMFMLLIMFLPVESSKKVKKKPILNISKEIYFNPNQPFTEIEYDIKKVGYRLQQSDTLETGAVKNKYFLYKNILGVYPKSIYIFIYNDLLIRIDYYFDVKTVKEFRKIVDNCKKFSNYDLVDFHIHEDEEYCGRKYQTAYQYVFDYQSFVLFIPIDFEKTFVRFRVNANDSIGYHMRNMYNTLEGLNK